MNLQTIAGPNNNSEGKSVQYATDKCHDALRSPQQALAKQKIPWICTETYMKSNLRTLPQFLQHCLTTQRDIDIEHWKLL